MAKDKNRSSKNVTHKLHRNGFYKPKKHEYTSTKGMNVKFLRNLHAARVDALQKKKAKIAEARAAKKEAAKN